MTRKWTKAERDYLVTVGRRIAERRRAFGLSQEQLGERAGLHRTYIGAVERGTTNVGAANLGCIAHGLETDVGDLTAGLSVDPFAR